MGLQLPSNQIDDVFLPGTFHGEKNPDCFGSRRGDLCCMFQQLTDLDNIHPKRMRKAPSRATIISTPKVKYPLIVQLAAQRKDVYLQVAESDSGRLIWSDQMKIGDGDLVSKHQADELKIFFGAPSQVDWNMKFLGTIKKVLELREWVFLDKVQDTLRIFGKDGLFLIRRVQRTHLHELIQVSFLKILEGSLRKNTKAPGVENSEGIVFLHEHVDLRQISSTVVQTQNRIHKIIIYLTLIKFTVQMDAIFKRQFRRWAWDPAVTERVNSLRQQMLSTQRAREQRHADKGISLGDAISELKKYINGSTDEAVRKGRVTLNLVCKLTKGTNGGFRGYIGLPHVVPNRDERILVFCDEARVGDSLRAGAAVAGGAELVNDIVDGKLKFTRCLATPGMFPTVAKLARILGPMGLMPNLRHGTLTDDLVPAIGRALSIAPYRIVKESGVMNICIAEVTEFNDA